MTWKTWKPENTCQCPRSEHALPDSSLHFEGRILGAAVAQQSTDADAGKAKFVSSAPIAALHSRNVRHARSFPSSPAPEDQGAFAPICLGWIVLVALIVNYLPAIGTSEFHWVSMGSMIVPCVAGVIGAVALNAMRVYLFWALTRRKRSRIFSYYPRLNRSDPSRRSSCVAGGVVGGAMSIRRKCRAGGHPIRA
jgi:hypothetical protein